MLSFLIYLLKVICCSAVLYGYYRLFLRDKIFHQYNRFYLLASIVISLLLPLIKINIFHSQNEADTGIKLLSIVTGSNEYMDEIIITSHRTSFSATQYFWILYILICLVFGAIFIKVLLRIRSIISRHRYSKIGNILLVGTLEKGTPFSFLNYIFWNDNIDINTTTGSLIFKHELAHIYQKHSLDKLFINVVLIFYWCNPIFWLVQKELAMIHEFMADKIAVENNDTDAFAAMILKSTYPQYQLPFTNSFFYSPIKRRLIMLTKNKNLRAGYIGRLLVLPLAVLLFAAFSVKTKTFSTKDSAHYSGKTFTVVIDAGHGGFDFGAKSIDGTIFEKDLTLSIIKKIKEKNLNDNINIILTRNEDIYLSSLQKVELSKSHQPDLFISFHVDANPSQKVESLRSGMSVWVTKDDFKNAAGSKLFASAIIQEFKKDYKIPILVESPMQRNTDIFILQQNECPAVLIETGIITNNTDLAYLQTEEAKETIAKNVLAAINKFANQLNGNIENPVVTNGLITKHDTIPAKPSNKKNNIPENTLYIVDGKILGRGKGILQQIEKLSADKSQYPHIVSMNVISKEKAKIKYGLQGEDGAIEISTSRTVTDKMKKEKVGIVKKENITDTLPDDKVFTKVENEASFPDGNIGWRNYLTKNLDAGIPVKEGMQPGSYTVIVSFIVKKDGSIANVTADTYQGSAMAKACIDLIKNGPKWLPAMQNGRQVTAYRRQPITFAFAAD